MNKVNDMPQYKIFSGFNEDEVTQRVNKFINKHGWLWSSVDQEYTVTATPVIDTSNGGKVNIIYKHFILLKFKTSGTFKGE
jgi:hypothetical protein